VRIALFTLESLASAEAVLRLVARDPARIVLLGRSDPYRHGLLAGARRHLGHSGWAILPYLAANFVAPGLLRRSGRLSDLCRAAGIPCLRLRDVNSAQAQARLRAARPDVILSFHFDQIFTAETLAIAPLGGVNVHPSLLPRHRGPIPTLYALAEAATGVSIHTMAERIDAGGVLAQRAVALPPGLSVGGAARMLHLAALPVLEEALALLPARPEPPPLLPYCPFPDGPTLSGLRAQGVRLVTADDAKASLFAPAGGWR
jgi:hypothetical protein